MSSTERGAAPEMSFSEAMQELEAVLRRIEGEEIDIDRLGAELGRAAKLLEICRGKIRRAEVEVRQIVEQIEEDAPGSTDAAAGAGGAVGAAGPESSAAPGSTGASADAAGAEAPAARLASADEQDDIPF